METGRGDVARASGGLHPGCGEDEAVADNVSEGNNRLFDQHRSQGWVWRGEAADVLGHGACWDWFRAGAVACGWEPRQTKE